MVGSVTHLYRYLYMGVGRAVARFVTDILSVTIYLYARIFTYMIYTPYSVTDPHLLQTQYWRGFDRVFGVYRSYLCVTPVTSVTPVRGD